MSERVSFLVRSSISLASRSATPPILTAWPGMDLPRIAGALPRKRAFRDHDDGKMPARPAAGGDFLAHLLDVVRNFRDENHVGRTGESGVQRDEPRVAAHHLENDHAIVALGRGVE